MGIQITSGRALGVFSLVMINVIAIDNLRSLTVGAEFGLALVSFYALAAILFFVPTILVTAELATGWPSTGGVYVWVREAFGAKWGFLTIWLQWIYNVVWYPTIFTFIAGIFAYLIHPDMKDNPLFMLTIILSAFWLTTLVNCFGLKISTMVSAIGALLGTIFPMVLIACLGLVWVYTKQPTSIHFSANHLLPSHIHLSDLAFFTNILFGLMGIEMSAVHAGDVKNPRRDYPKALIYSAIIILTTLALACLAIAVVVPADKLNLVSGLIDAYGIFFKAYNMSWFIPIIAVLIILGSMSGATAWILGPARGLLVASEETRLPAFFTKRNKYHMPIGILMTQGAIVTVLCTVFLVMPSVSSSYWALSNLTAQLALIFYIMLFAAAIRLRQKKPHVKRAYRIPFGMAGTVVVCGVGIMTCFLAIGVGFLPPTQVAVGNVFVYESILVGGIIICCLPPFILYARQQKKTRKKGS